MPRPGYGLKDGSQKGRREGGRGRNIIEKCRHPNMQRRRENAKRITGDL